MTVFLLLLVMSVFLGTKLLAISTPVAQLTLYRILALGVPILLFVQYHQKNKQLKILANSDASRAVISYTIWWFYAIVSFLWAIDLKLWFQAVFLLSLGWFVILALYFWLEHLTHWYRLVFGIWGMLCFQIIWGYQEIITGVYLYADLAKLDKYQTFSTQPITRIPITFFANQNDYATMLLAFLPIAYICYHRVQSMWMRLIIALSGALASYLIYRSDSRMALLMLIFFFILLIISQFKLYFATKQIKWTTFFSVLVLVCLYLIKPGPFRKMTKLLLSQTQGVLTGDGARVNLAKNGLLFLAQTFGFGVGAGNIEAWMAQATEYPTNQLVNIHHWWLEILVGYGWVIFMIYITIYGMLLRRLYFIYLSMNNKEKHTPMALILFMITFVFSSMTSANNLLIEWHWIFFSMIISYIKIIEREFLLGGLK